MIQRRWEARQNIVQFECDFLLKKDAENSRNANFIFSKFPKFNWVGNCRMQKLHYRISSTKPNELQFKCKFWNHFPFFFERRGLITKKEVQLQSCETFSICFTFFFHHFMAKSNTDPSSVILHCTSMLKIALPVQQPRQI